MATAKKAPVKAATPAKKAAPVKAAAPAKKVAAAAKPAKAPEKAVKAAPAAKTAAPAKKVNAAFMKPLTISADLAAVIGATPVPRTEVVKQLWVYIKANKLQDAKNKRNINADAKLKKVFGKAQVTMFEMPGLIGKHLS